MNTCFICNKEHKYAFNIHIDTESDCYVVCPTCFLLANPAYNQLKNISQDDIYRSSHPALNLYLYKKLCNVYSLPIKNTNNKEYTSTKPKQKTERNSNRSSLVDLSKLEKAAFFGRENDIKNVFNILGRKEKRNPIIVGPSGVGKTALVHHIAKMIADGEAPDFLCDKEVLELNVTSIVSGTKYRGDLEEKVSNLIKEVDGENAIIFIDDIQMITSSGATADDNTNIGQMLKPFLYGGNIQIIGAITTEEYSKTFENNKSLSRMFQPVYIEEQSVDETVELMKSVAKDLQEFHNITISDDNIRDCVRLADKYIKYRAFPDKAIDLLDMTCSRKKNSISSTYNTCDVEKFMKSKKIVNKLNTLKSSTDLIDIILVNQEARQALAECSRYIQDEFEKQPNLCGGVIDKGEITLKDLSEVIEFWTKIPVSAMSQNYKEQLKNVSPTIKKSVIGQDEAVDTVVASVCRRKLGITNSKRPSSFIFVGETGIGKTELAKSLTKAMFGSESKLIRFDMSEYMESHSVSKLIGAPPGYVGYNEPGQLTNALKRNPFCVILFDEIEKAHSDVSNILLQLLDDGRITDAKGEVIDASNAIIILTSNAGANLSATVGFGKNGLKDEESFKKGLEKAFRPEFLGRVDNIITFKSLTNDDYKSIAEIHLNKIVVSLKDNNNIELTYSDSIPEWLCQKADTAKYHAREIARTVTKYIEDAIANAVIEYESDVSQIRVVVNDDNEINILINDEAYSKA